MYRQVTIETLSNNDGLQQYAALCQQGNKIDYEHKEPLLANRTGSASS